MPAADDRCAALREFNRFYTRRIGVLHDKLPGGRFSLAESRVLWELAHTAQTTAGELAQALDLDAGYLSRLVRGLQQQGLVQVRRAEGDARRKPLAITAAGRRAFAPLDRRTQQRTAELLATLGDAQQQELLGAMARIQTLLGGRSRGAAFVLRAHRPGDIGWVTSRHGALYAREYGWDERFEALVARIAADFIDRFEPAREACWIAERDGSPIGSVFLVQARDEATQAVEPGIAQLRLLLVEPSARGQGLGLALVNECERFARARGYARIRLWTQSILVAARSIYRRCGYRLVATEPHTSFGHNLVGENWELALD